MAKHEYNLVFVIISMFLYILSSAHHLFQLSNITAIRNKRQYDECSTHFRCKTVEDCVRFEQVCDGQKDCADGSDEDSSVCVGYKSTERTYIELFKCLPPTIPNGKVIIVHPSPDDDRRVYSHSQLRFICDPGYKLYQGSPFCYSTGNWVRLPECKRDCPPLISTNLIKVNCSQDCSESAEDGTIASFACKEFYKPSNKTAKNLQCSNGVWNDTFFECKPDCGKPTADDIVEKLVFNRIQFPWQVSFANDTRIHIVCKGTIITPSIVLSAASCFTDDLGRRYPASFYYVRTSNVEIDLGKFVQRRYVKTYFIPEIYKGRESNFAGDLAVVVLEKPFDITDTVQPVCIDWNNNADPQEFSADKLKKVDYTDFISKANRIEEAKSQILNWRFIDYKKCEDVAPEDKKQWITKDKFCAASVNDLMICDGYYNNYIFFVYNSGDGLVFADTNNRYYLRGILAGKETLFCNKNGMYTDIYLYKDFISEIVKRNNVVGDECGELTTNGETYVVNGKNSIKNSFPWHVGLYHYENENYEYRCGGSIISPALVITAAHCVTTESGVGIPAEEFHVAAGKYYSDFNSLEDNFVQKRRVREYRIPSTYAGYHTNYIGDLAVIILKQKFRLTNVVKPVCLDWSNSFESQHLQQNKIGSVVGWGSTDSSIIKKSSELKQLDVPFIDIRQCLDEVPSRFRRWITSDKFCAGYTNGSSVCKGDSGGGLVFQRNINTKQKFYIRGIVSVGPLDTRKFLACNNFKYGVYTKISSYINFISSIKKETEI